MKGPRGHPLDLISQTLPFTTADQLGGSHGLSASKNGVPASLNFIKSRICATSKLFTSRRLYRRMPVKARQLQGSICGSDASAGKSQRQPISTARQPRRCRQRLDFRHARRYNRPDTAFSAALIHQDAESREWSFRQTKCLSAKPERAAENSTKQRRPRLTWQVDMPCSNANGGTLVRPIEPATAQVGVAANSATECERKTKEKGEIRSIHC